MKLEDAINIITKNMLFLIINKIQFTSRDQNNLIIMYGLPRIHKKNPPLRPIFASFSQHSFIQPCKIFLFPFLTLSLDQSIVKNSVLSALLQTLQLEEPIHIAIIDNLQ